MLQLIQDTPELHNSVHAGMLDFQTNATNNYSALSFLYMNAYTVRKAKNGGYVFLYHFLPKDHTMQSNASRVTSHTISNKHPHHLITIKHYFPTMKSLLENKSRHGTLERIGSSSLTNKLDNFCSR
jgi:hypothetical protein